ncbi:unnamed protein product [Alopecurus aequalis]
MASRKRSSSTRRRSDRISSLDDDLLGHVLSFLPTKEAARAAALASRWRHVFGSVHTISLEEQEGEREKDWDTYFVEAEEHKSCSDTLLDGMNAALLCRRRCPRLTVPVPVRSLRFAFDRWHYWDKVAVDQWLAYVLRRVAAPVAIWSSTSTCASASPPSVTPRERLFSCAAIRTLCLCNCRLDLPGVPIDLPFLETLRLTSLQDPERSIQQLISSCPRLADLTLEAMFTLKRVSVVDNKRLRRFALLCCHNMRSVDIDVSELRSLEYKGRVPKESLLSLHGSPAIIPSYTIELCRAPYHSEEFARLTSFLRKISDTKHLHLHHHRLESRFFAAGFPLFAGLTWLTLQGCVRTCYTVTAVGKILEQTPSLEVLRLIMKEPQQRFSWRYMNDDDKRRVPNEITVPDKLNFSIPCLRQRLRVFSMEGYDGCEPQSLLAKLVLRNELVLERLHIMFAEGLSSKQKRELKIQMRRWGVASLENIFI